MGWPRLQPLPEKFTNSSSSPYSRHAAIGTDAKASLISHSATSDGFNPARCNTFPITFTAPSPVSRGGVQDPRLFAILPRSAGRSPWVCPVVGAAGRRHACHRGHPQIGNNSAPGGSGTGHDVSRLARAGRSAGTPMCFRRSRLVGVTPRQPGGAVAARTTARTRCAGEAVRDDRSFRALLRLSGRHRHAAVGVGQLR